MYIYIHAKATIIIIIVSQAIMHANFQLHDSYYNGYSVIKDESGIFELVLMLLAVKAVHIFIPVT